MATNSKSVDERTDHLETRMENLEDRMEALNGKIDVAMDSIRGDIKTVLERVDSLGAEMRREFAGVRKEHRADNRLVLSILKDHNIRIRALERVTKAKSKSG